MKLLLSSLLFLSTTLLFAQSQVFKPSTPQIIYEMYVESVEPLHRAFEKSLTIVHKPNFSGNDLKKLFDNSRHALETFHKDRLHRDAYTAADNYLKSISPLIVEVAPILDAIAAADDAQISGLIAKMQDITIKEKPIADQYRENILKVIDLFKEDWAKWLSDEVIHFARLQAKDRNALYETGFGKTGLHAVKRRFYTADYFVVDMERDVTESRVNSIRARFEDLSKLPSHMVQNIDDFIAGVEEPLLRYHYEKTVDENLYTYSKGKNTTLDFVVKKVEIIVHSRQSDTVTIKFYY